MAGPQGHDLRIEDADISLVSWNRYLLVCWLERATVPSVEKLNEASKKLVGRYESGFSAIHYIRPGAPLPEQPARKALNDAVAEFQNGLLSAAVIVEGGGFWGSALRSFVTGLSMFSKLRGNIRVFSERKVAIEWCVQTQDDPPAVANKLVGLLETMLPRPEARP